MANPIIDHIPDGFVIVKMAGGCEYCVRKKSCFDHCQHLTDIFWDWTNGPYLIVCEVWKEQDPEYPATHGVCGDCTYYKKEVND